MKNFILFYNGEEIDQLTPEEEIDLSMTLTSSRRPASIKWKGNTVETRKLVIRKRSIENIEVNNERVKILEEIKKEREELKKQTPEEKTFRNYKCIFCWRYLLQYGFTRFFETKDWKREMPHDTFQRFDKLIWERKLDLMKRFTKALEEYFTENPEEIWCDREILTRFLPKGDTASKDILIKKMFAS